MTHRFWPACLSLKSCRPIRYALYIMASPSLLPAPTLNDGWLRLLDPAQPAESASFATRLPNPVDLAVEADGSLLVLVRRTNVHDEHFTPKSGQLLRIRYAAP